MLSESYSASRQAYEKYVDQLERTARRFGAARLRLETGIYQREAIGFYERLGFEPCGPFGPYLELPANTIEKSLFYEKDL